MAFPSMKESDNRPSNSAFKQQKLSAWQPILTAGTVLPTFFIIGLAFIPIGIGLLASTREVQEIVIDYADCESKNVLCERQLLAPNSTHYCICEKRFNLNETFKSTVFMYYGLSNFFQNHRRYVKSRDDNQLKGHISTTEVVKACKLYDKDPDGHPYIPCGAIANSLFNDSITLKYSPKGTDQWTDVSLIGTGIAWPTDKNVKFKNPNEQQVKEILDKARPPPNWKPLFWEKFWKIDNENKGFQNEDFIIWMRTAAFPQFRKLYRRINHTQTNFINGMSNEYDYLLVINYTYPVSPFDGKKRIIFSNTSWIGGKNPFLGIAYIVVGCLCLVLAIVLLVVHIKFGKSTRELISITQKTCY